MSFLLRMMMQKYRNEEAGDLPGDTSAGAVSDPAPESTETDVNWEGMSNEFAAEDEGLDVEGDVEVVEPAAPVEPAPTEPAATPAATPTAVEPAATPAPASTEPVAPAPVAPTATNEEYSAWRQNRLTQLEQVYALDQEAANAMLTEPETVLPKLAAKVHMEVLENSMRAMQAMVPVMMQQVQHHAATESRAKSLFTTVNPDLADPRYEPAIMQLGSVYRNVNQQASPEEAARAIGNLVRAALGIAAPAQGQAPAAPRAPAPAPAAPFAPARGAGGGAIPAAPSNPYEMLAQEMLNEDW